MKNVITLLLFLFFIQISVFSNGVAVKDGTAGTYLNLQSSKIQVVVEGQISTTTVTNQFKNTGAATVIKYAFPLSEQASATNLRWLVNGIWHAAVVSATPQDTSLPGGGTVYPNLKTYLGNTPLYFGIPQTIEADSILTVELTYVELLPYKFGKVTYKFPNDYQLIQTTNISTQDFQFYLNSQRTIDSLIVTCSYPVDQMVNNGNSAIVKILRGEIPASSNYGVQYVLNSNQLGLFGYSTYNSMNMVPDSLQRGFFTFIAEPDPSTTTATIHKVFTLIVDRSGSMSGTKMDQAINAAKYIVQNINESDKFNLIDFDDAVTCFRPGHVEYTVATRDSAIAYINTLFARNLTSISGAFGTAIPQFSSASDSTANIIIFLTDGQPTVGITETDQLVSYISGLVSQSGKTIFVYCFGIGSDANAQLLTLISSKNRGFAQMLGNDELYSSITDFYMSVRNPVLLDPTIAFNPPLALQVYPDSLPNLYKGSQMILSGRYTTPGQTSVTLSGKAFAKQVNYNYSLSLVDTMVTQNQLLLKLWAKRKIESLLIKYYSLPSGSPEALEIKNAISYLSQTYGVLSPLTSFTGGGGGTGIEEKGDKKFNTLPKMAFQLEGNYPNPFNPSTRIKINIAKTIAPFIEVKIYSITGKLIRIIPLMVHGEGEYSISWDGTNQYGIDVPSGVYLYVVSYADQIQAGKMVLMR
jgi:Ca-activated chloride channel family protein